MLVVWFPYDNNDAAAADDDGAIRVSSCTYTECCFSISSMQVKQNHG